MAEPAIQIFAEDWAGLRATAKLKDRSGPGRKPDREVKAGDDFWRDEAKWVNRVYQVDRAQNTYHEQVSDPETGRIIHEESGPLNEHHNRRVARMEPEKDEQPGR
jgi:hypothetical protein